jgi:type I restriction enzyme S subunit
MTTRAPNRAANSQTATTNGSPVRLGDLVDIKHGWPFKSNLFFEELSGRPIVVNIGNFQYTGGFRFASTTVKEYRGDYPAEYKLDPGEILLVMTCQTPGGEILGIPGRIPNDGKTYLHNQRLGRVVVKRPDLISDRYLYWLFLTREFNRELCSTATGTKILHTAPTRIEAFRFQLPSLAEQERIADILGTLDDRIELNRRMNETLESTARRLFKSWFVDFDPVHAKAAVRRQHPNWANDRVSRDALPKFDPKIAELFPDDFEDSTQGPIPKSWHVARIDEVAEINSWTLSKNDALESIDYVEISEVMRGNVGKVPQYRRGQEPSRARRRVRHGDTVLSTVRPDRRAYFVCLHPHESLIASTGFAVVTGRTVPWSWIACALTSDDVFEYLGHHAHGGAYPAVNPTLIGAIEYAMPGAPLLLEAFHGICAPIFELADANRRSVKSLADTRDRLLPQLLGRDIDFELSVR